MRWLRRIGLAAAILLALALAALLTHPGRVAAKSLLLIPYLFPQTSLGIVDRLTPTPSRQELQLDFGSGQSIADLYRPGTAGRHGAVIIFLGVAPAGRDDPRLVRLAEGLARAGSVVMIPESSNMIESRIAVEDIDRLVAAFQYLSQQPFVDPQRIGFAGFCVGASLAIVAAEDPRIDEQVAFVNDFGGYYDMRDYVRAVATGLARYEGRYGSYDVPWSPGAQPTEVATRHLINSIEDAGERALLQRSLLDGVPQDPEALARLSPPARAVYELMSVGDPDRADVYLSVLPQKARETLALLSPSAGIERLRARMFIMHDQGDWLVPPVESLRMAEALEGRADVHYTEFSLFQHVDPTRSVDPVTFAREVAKLYLHVYKVMLELL